MVACFLNNCNILGCRISCVVWLVIPFLRVLFCCPDRVQHMLSQHVGKNQLIFPPYSPERVDELGEQVATDFDIVGAGWREVRYSIQVDACVTRCTSTVCFFPRI